MPIDFGIMRANCSNTVVEFSLVFHRFLIKNYQKRFNDCEKIIIVKSSYGSLLKLFKKVHMLIRKKWGISPEKRGYAGNKRFKVRDIYLIQKHKRDSASLLPTFPIFF